MLIVLSVSNKIGHLFLISISSDRLQEFQYVLVELDNRSEYVDRNDPVEVMPSNKIKNHRVITTIFQVPYPEHLGDWSMPT